MKNRNMWKLNDIIEIKICGKNIHNYIKRVLIKNKIDILKLTYLNYKEVLVVLRYKDYLKVQKLPSIYDISINKKLGRLNLKDKIKKNKILLILIALGIVLLYMLSNIIFGITVIHNVKDVRVLVYKELSKNGLTKYTWKKSYNELENIEEKILNDNKDKLEWIEINVVGTKYVVRVEERKINSDKNEYKYQSIVSSKNCILYKINAVKGEKVKNINDYVKEDEVVISGYITMPDNTQKTTMALGSILGEVWYTIKVNYPYTYYEEKYTGRKRKVLVFHFFKYDIPIFSFSKYRSFNIKKRELVKDYLNNISISLDTHFELNAISKIYTYDEAINKGVEVGIDKLKSTNDKIIDIKDIDIIKSNDNGDNVEVIYFVKAIEDVTKIIDIENINEDYDN